MILVRNYLRLAQVINNEMQKMKKLIISKKTYYE